jgi:3D (Asp-Asp-Asp) domain-containing protein
MSDTGDEAPIAAPPRHRPARAARLCAAVLLSTTCATAMVAHIEEVGGISIWVLLAQAERTDHPLANVVQRVIAGELGEQPLWKLPMLANALRKKPLEATLTAYTEFDPGCTTRTAWGSRVRRGIVAADRRYWGPGSVIWIGPPICETVIVEDVGSAIKGRHRFDVCFPGDLAGAKAMGLRRHVTYVPLHREPPRRRWTAKAAGWHPPIWKPGIPAPGAEARVPAPQDEPNGILMTAAATDPT